MDSKPSPAVSEFIKNYLSNELSEQVEEPAAVHEFNAMVRTINEIYNAIIATLTAAADRSIPKVKVDTLKYWWDQELRALKQHSI